MVVEWLKFCAYNWKTISSNPLSDLAQTDDWVLYVLFLKRHLALTFIVFIPILNYFLILVNNFVKNLDENSVMSWVAVFFFFFFAVGGGGWVLVLFFD